MKFLPANVLEGGPFFPLKAMTLTTKSQCSPPPIWAFLLHWLDHAAQWEVRSCWISILWMTDMVLPCKGYQGFILGWSVGLSKYSSHSKHKDWKSPSWPWKPKVFSLLQGIIQEIIPPKPTKKCQRISFRRNESIYIYHMLLPVN